MHSDTGGKMSRGYQRLDALERILDKKAKVHRKSSSEKCEQLKAKYGSLANPYQFKQTGHKLEVIEEKDLRKEIPGQLEIGESNGK